MIQVMMCDKTDMMLTIFTHFKGIFLHVPCLELSVLLSATLGRVGEWSSGAEHNLSS